MEPKALHRGGEQPNRGIAWVKVFKGDAGAARSSALSSPNTASRVAMLRDSMDTQVRQWEAEVRDLEERASAMEAEARVRAGALVDNTDLAELRASAYKASVQAQQDYQHQVMMLKASVDTQTRMWRHELASLHAGSGGVWAEPLYGKLEMVQRKLSAWGRTGGGTWQGFMGEVEKVLSQAEQHLRQADAGNPVERQVRRDN